MSGNIWDTYGYGICVSDIGEPPVERIRDLLAMAPVLNEAIQEWFKNNGITDPDYRDYMEIGMEHMLGLATILKKLILEAENVNFEDRSGPEGEIYLMFYTGYGPLDQPGRILGSEDEVVGIFRKYTSVLTDKPITVHRMQICGEQDEAADRKEDTEMGCGTWHAYGYGYGICVSDIGEPPVERFRALLAMAPELQKEIQERLDERGITDPGYDDYVEFYRDYMSGLATILKYAILEAENVELMACDSAEGKDYLLFPPDYPWNKKERRRPGTKEEVDDLFQKYISVLTDEPIVIDYRSVRNGG